MEQFGYVFGRRRTGRELLLAARCWRFEGPGTGSSALCL